MLGRAVDGAYGYGTDIGGYSDLFTPATTKELFLRWAEWAALSPVFRLHGSGIHGTHTRGSTTRRRCASTTRCRTQRARRAGRARGRYLAPGLLPGRVLALELRPDGPGPHLTIVAASLTQLPYFTRCHTRAFAPVKG